jgi:hypothetical protein
MAYMGDICVVTGKYTDNQGQSKNRYEKIGAWFQDGEGRISIKVTMIPLIPPSKEGDSGFFASLFHQQDNGKKAAPAPQQQPQQQPPAQPQAQGWYDAQGIYHQGTPPGQPARQQPQQESVPF